MTCNEYGIPIQFSDNGKPIADIGVWAEERGEPMVRVKHTWREPLPLAGRIEDREEVIEMPRCFAVSMRFGGIRDDQYEILES